MRKKLIILFLLTLIILSPIVAEDLSVDYIDGFLDLLQGGKWVEVFPGDILSSGDTIRLDKDSFVELQGRNKTLSITEPGTYEIAKLLAARAQTEALGLGNLVSGKMAVMLKGNQVQTQSAVGGVRAAEVESAPAVDWMESEALELIDEGKQFLTAGDTKSAISRFQNAYDLAMDDQEEIQSCYNLGYAYALDGQTGKALEYLTKVKPDPYMEDYHSHYLLTGNLLVNSFAYDRAIVWFEGYTPGQAAYKSPETEQMIYLLNGVSYKMKGNTPKAKAMLQKAVDVNSQTDTAAKAKELIASL